MLTADVCLHSVPQVDHNITQMINKILRLDWNPEGSLHNENDRDLQT